MYTLPLRLEGVRVGLPVGAAALRRIGVDQLEIEPAKAVSANTLVSELLPPAGETHPRDCVAMDDKGHYLGIVTTADLRLAEIQPDAAPLLLVGEVVRTDVPPLCLADSAERTLELCAERAGFSAGVHGIAVYANEPEGGAFAGGADAAVSCGVERGVSGSSGAARQNVLKLRQ